MSKTKIMINKAYFHELLHRRYGQYIRDNKRCIDRYLQMLACECDVSLRTIYHFQANSYSCTLMKNIIDALNLTQEEFNRLIELKVEEE